MSHKALELSDRRKKQALQRVFIGIPVDVRSQQQINKLLEPIKDPRHDLRWVPENNRHMTLAFLGDIEAPVVENLVRLFDEVYRREACFNYRLSLLTRFPNSKGRIIALTGEPTDLLDHLYQLTLDFLTGNDVEFDRKRFRPHVTLGRIKKAKQVKTNFDKQAGITLDINRVRFYRSTLSQRGSVYQVMSEVELIV
jgi:2'-5' RNA ligase